MANQRTDINSFDNLGAALKSGEEAAQNEASDLDERREHVNVSSVSRMKTNLLAEQQRQE